jgi:hypothetical protein
MTDRDTLIALLRILSRQSDVFQRMVHEYAVEVMTDPETHQPFAERLAAGHPVQSDIVALQASLSPDSSPLPPLMQDLLERVDGLQNSHTSLREIASLVSVELVYKLRETL